MGEKINRIIIYLSFSIKIANAQGFWVKFIDSDENGKINFTIFAHNEEDQIYYIGLAGADHTVIYGPLLQIPAGGSNSISVSWSGRFLIDIYLTLNPSNINTYFWTSQGYAIGNSTGATLSIDWFSGSGIHVVNYYFSFSDNFEIVAVPIPSALWFLGSGIITLSLIRKRLLSY